MALVDRLSSSGPKQILALDGGGIRGALTVGFLARIEQILRERHGRPDLLFCDYFDLIGGTSTGAIIAAALSIGMSADEVTRSLSRIRRRGRSTTAPASSVCRVSASCAGATTPSR